MEYEYERKLKEKRKKRYESIAVFCIILVVMVLVSWFVHRYVAQILVVSGASMNNTLSDGDKLIIEKLSYEFGEIDRFDIVVFEYEEDNGNDVYYIKRIIGLPGETVNISDGKIYIDDELLEEDYGYYIDDKEMRSYMEEEIYLEEGEYFVLGDNRNNSVDSRKIGAVNKESIIGRAVFRISPFSDAGAIE